jgi:hypothetical protein
VSFWLCALLAAVCGAVIGVLDLASGASSDVQPVVLLVLLFSGFFGLVRPRRAWLWALLVGGGVPVGHVLGPALGRAPAYPVEPGRWITLLALIPALLGAGAGAAVGWVVARLRGRHKAR